MPRNRRTQSAEVRFGPALKALLICLFIGGAGVGYVCQKNQLNQLGRQKKEREHRLQQLRVANDELARLLAQQQAVQTLELGARALGLGPPRPAQIVVLDGRQPPAQPRARDAQVAQQSETSTAPRQPEGLAR